jgi:hypothetical protein
MFYRFLNLCGAKVQKFFDICKGLERKTISKSLDIYYVYIRFGRIRYRPDMPLTYPRYVPERRRGITRIDDVMFVRIGDVGAPYGRQCIRRRGAGGRARACRLQAPDRELHPTGHLLPPDHHQIWISEDRPN